MVPIVRGALHPAVELTGEPTLGVRDDVVDIAQGSRYVATTGVLAPAVPCRNGPAQCAGETPLLRDAEDRGGPVEEDGLEQRIVEILGELGGTDDVYLKIIFHSLLN